LVPIVPAEAEQALIFESHAAEVVTAHHRLHHCCFEGGDGLKDGQAAITATLAMVI
jgi:hypothetical protein